MFDEQALLAACPDFISIGGLLKATPSQEGDARVLYLEASNEDRDHQNEIVLQKALTDSQDYFLRHGNVDISHYSLIGLKQGIPNHLDYEIGRPTAVRVGGSKTFVKCELYRGDSPQARNASMVWDSITKQKPPMRWYPSVGGAVLAKSIKVDPKTKSRFAVVEKVRWNNLALDRTPVNATVPEASMAPIGTFAKAFGGFVIKGLTAGYGTDSASLQGGSALREQSLDGAAHSYFQMRDALSDAMSSGKAGKNPGARELVEYGSKVFGLSPDESAELVERFMRDVKTGLSRRSKS